MQVIPRYQAMGSWKVRKIEKAGRGRSEKTKVGRVYLAIPPVEGWLGGDPVKNGYKPAGGK